jgi:hypothetical protein
MSMLKRWIIKLLGIFSRTEKPTEEELIAYGRQLERQEIQKRTYVWIDPTVRARGYEQNAWNAEADRTTEKPTIIPQPRGRYFQEQRKSFEKTHLLPTVKRPPQDELPFTSAEMTAVRIPTWLL